MTALWVILQGVARGVLISTFLTSAVGKLASQSAKAELADTMRTQFGIDRRLAPLGVGALLVAEVVSSVLLALPIPPQPGSLVAIATLGLLTIGVATLVVRRQRVTCRCFGTAGGTLGIPHLVRNALLLACAAASLLLPAHETSAAVTYFAMGLGAVLALPIIQMDVLLELFRPSTDLLEKT